MYNLKLTIKYNLITIVTQLCNQLRTAFSIADKTEYVPTIIK